MDVDIVSQGAVSIDSCFKYAEDSVRAYHIELNSKNVRIIPYESDGHLSVLLYAEEYSTHLIDEVDKKEPTIVKLPLLSSKWRILALGTESYSATVVVVRERD